MDKNKDFAIIEHFHTQLHCMNVSAYTMDSKSIWTLDINVAALRDEMSKQEPSI